MIIFQDKTYNLAEFIHLLRIQFYSKKVNTSNVIYWGVCKYLTKHVGKNPSYQKIKMLKKHQFVVESCVIIGSFDYHCTK
jgi:hypothetical protein